MLLTMDDANYLSQFLEIDNSEKQTMRIKVDHIPEKDKELLLIYDNDFYFAKGYHMITDYKKLKAAL